MDRVRFYAILFCCSIVELKFVILVHIITFLILYIYKSNKNFVKYSHLFCLISVMSLLFFIVIVTSSYKICTYKYI